jgi:hypothetical protein
MSLGLLANLAQHLRGGLESQADFRMPKMVTG